MARRVTWTNNSTDYDDTNIYRDTTIDPQNLPEPIATVGSVAQGATVGYIDLTGSGDQCYAVRDFDSSGDGALSEAYCFEVPDPFEGASVGDEIEGGIYAGTITYADAREYHIVASKASGQSSVGVTWGHGGTITGANDDDDGLDNHQVIMGLGGSSAFDHADNYSTGGYSDWYVPAKNELGLVYDNLSTHAEFADLVADEYWVWTSTEAGSNTADTIRFGDNFRAANNKEFNGAVTRPVRRVAV